MKKNLLILHADQLRYDGTGCNGNPYARTPNIDALADAGSVFSRHVSSNPICMPSRATLMTGLYPPGHGVYANGIPLNRTEYYKIPQDEIEGEVIKQPITIADHFAGAGYDTASFGKLHLTPYRSDPACGFQESYRLWESGVLDDWTGPYYGFRHVEMTHGHGEGTCRTGHYARWLEKNHPELRKTVRSGRRLARPIESRSDLYPSVIPSEMHNSNWLAERFCRYLDEHRGRETPFMAFVGFPDPHPSWAPSHDIVKQFEAIDVPDFHDPDGEAIRQHPFYDSLQDQSVLDLSREERKTIVRYTYAMIHQIDMAAGKMMQALKDEGLWDDTIVVFTSDHGDYLCNHGLIAKSGCVTDDLLHLPFILRAPGSNLPKATDIPMSNADVLPTLSALCGLAAPAGIHGSDVVPAVRDNEERHVFAYVHDGTAATGNVTVYDTRRRLTCYPHAGYVELFDHRDDPGETRNLASDDSMKSVTSDMKRVLEQHMLMHYNPIAPRCSLW